MPKPGKQFEHKKAFVNLAFRDKKAAAKILRDKAKALENCKSVDDVAFGLSDILFLDRSSIFRLNADEI